jgi:hypothetical protein
MLKRGREKGNGLGMVDSSAMALFTNGAWDHPPIVIIKRSDDVFGPPGAWHDNGARGGEKLLHTYLSHVAHLWVFGSGIRRVVVAWRGVANGFGREQLHPGLCA